MSDLGGRAWIPACPRACDRHPRQQKQGVPALLRALTASFAFSLVLLLAACGGEADSSATATAPEPLPLTVVANGNVVKGLIRNGMVSAWRWLAGGGLCQGRLCPHWQRRRVHAEHSRSGAGRGPPPATGRLA